MNRVHWVVSSSLIVIALIAIGARSITAGQADSIVRLQQSTPGISQVGHINVTGTIRAGSVNTGTFRMVPGAANGKVLTSDANGNGSWQAVTGFSLPFIGSSSVGGGPVFKIMNTDTQGGGGGIFGQSSSPGGVGVRGLATGSGFGDPTYAEGGSFTASGVGGIGVYAESSDTTAANFGIKAYSQGPGGTGLYAEASDPAGLCGVQGVAGGSVGTGVLGTGGSVGVEGDGLTGVLGSSNVAAGVGMYGVSSYTTGTILGVYGVANPSNTSGIGVLGEGNVGVKGSTSSSTGYGVYGYSSSSTGNNYGGFFESQATGAYGLSTGTFGVGLMGEATDTSSNTIGVYGKAPASAGTGVIGHGLVGVQGEGGYIGAFGSSSSASGAGVLGENSATSGNAYGVHGKTSSSTGFAIYSEGALKVDGKATMTAFQLSTAPTTGYVLTSDGTGNGTWQAAAGLTLPFTGSAAANGLGQSVFSITNTATTGSNNGIYGRSNSTSGTAVRGQCTASTGNTYGGFFENASFGGAALMGRSNADGGVGVFANAAGPASNLLGTGLIAESQAVHGDAIWAMTSGDGYGGYFSTQGGDCVEAHANKTTGTGTAVLGVVISSDGTAVKGTGGKYAIYGSTTAASSYGVYGEGAVYGVYGKSSTVSGGNVGVYGEANGYGVKGVSANTGVYGSATSSSGGIGVIGDAAGSGASGVYGLGGQYGVIGTTAFSGGYGVYGLSSAGIGVYGSGSSYGLYGTSSGSNGIFGFSSAASGLHAETTATSSPGVFGSSTGATGYGVQGFGYGTGASYGGYFESSTHGGGFGLAGVVRYGSGLTVGTQGESYSSQGVGVAGIAWSLNGVTCGVRGESDSPSGYGVYSDGDLYIDGDLHATGTKGGYVSDIVLNVGDSVLTTGDLVEIVGYDEPVMGEIPVIRVRRSERPNSRAVLGPIDCALQLIANDRKPSRVSRLNYSSAQFHVHKVDGPIQPGSYGRVVTLGAFKMIKVNAAFGEIMPGDLLVSSKDPGYAMMSEDPRVGTVVGKALGSWKGGRGVIPVIVQSH